MEDYGYQNSHKLPEYIATMNSRNSRSIDKNSNRIKHSDFIKILYTKPLREYKKLTFKNGYRVRISKYDLPCRKS